MPHWEAGSRTERRVPQQLLDGGRHAVRVRAEPVGGAGPPQQLVGEVADVVHRRLVARDEEADAQADQLGLGQPVLAVPGEDEGAEQVLRRLGAAAGDEAGHVRDHVLARLQPLLR